LTCYDVFFYYSPGDFALIFKDKFKDRVQVTAIDPGEKDIELAKQKSTGNDVDFQLSDIFKFTSDSKFDLVMFTKSLHHCIPVDQVRKHNII
jgi:2-polyprenyl-3-methyl-5-hydroxy-6-metoxy-1,4-benzoquinol methylase